RRKTMSTTPTSAEPLVSPESPPVPVGGPSVPTLDELDTLMLDERRVFRRVGWGFYERLLNVVGERPWFRTAYDGKDLEIMTVGPFHDDLAELASELVKVIVEELEIPWRS